MEEHEHISQETNHNDEIHSEDNYNERLETPYVGMMFETWEEAQKYYGDYGRQEGFWIRIRSSSKTRAGLDEVTSKKFVCAHQGKYIPQNKEIFGEKHNAKTQSRSCSTVKCGCKANMRIILEKWSMKWRVSVFDDSHNHKVVTPAKRMKMRSNRHMPAAAKSLVETF
ncbi:FAR1 domain-containing protein [Heracleum sosnowskyi]|uniref:FAR1 domain-containing protein n=1 Tax=Heracleum sosnowskyi TaxID=360622 RepID=A0AAD8GTX1_9APIA|nr:FAR1 domain-containing protein [Heracleum sosnowskyi]